MKIVDRYMAKGFLGPYIWCLTLFLVMAVIIDIFSFIEDIVKLKIPAQSLISFYSYYLPTILLQVTPMAMLLSTIYVLSNLNKQNEITAMKSSGIGLWRILAPILIIGAITSVGIFVLNEKVIPYSSKMAATIRRDELERGKQRQTRDRFIKNVAVYGAGNRIVFARNFDTEKKTLENIIIHEHDASENLIAQITAQSAVWNEGAWKFSNVIMYHVDESGKFVDRPLFYKETVLPLKETPTDFINKEWRPEYMNMRQLNKYIGYFAGGGAHIVKGLLVELHYKLSFPFISLIIVLVGAPFALITTRGGVLIGVGLSVAIGLLYYAFIAICLAFGRAGILPPPVAAWLGNIVFTAVGIHLVNKRA